MILFRLHTENKNRKWIEQIVSKYFDGFSIQKQIGYWQGQKEKSLVIEIMTPKKSAPILIQAIVKQICGYNKQDCVLIQRIVLDGFLFSTGGGTI